MGGGHWSSNVYASTTSSRIASGTNFGYDSYTHSTRRDQWKAHESVDPLSVCGPTSPFAGRNIRESRDNDDHPNSTPIAIFFDETGSMGEVPRKLQKDLTKLFAMLIDQGLCPDPQIMMGAYGDVEVDRVPLQASQFESDNRVDEALDHLFLEGAGGGNNHEHSAMAWLFTALHTDTDNWNKRGKRGYLFTIGDEVSGVLPRGAIKQVMGDDFETNVTPKQALAMANEKWHVFHIVIDNYTARHQQSVRFYSDLLGGNCITLENLDDIAETIAMIIGFFEGSLKSTTTVSQTVVEKVSVMASGPRPALTVL